MHDWVEPCPLENGLRRKSRRVRSATFCISATTLSRMQRGYGTCGAGLRQGLPASMASSLETPPGSARHKLPCTGDRLDAVQRRQLACLLMFPDLPVDPLPTSND